MKNKIIASIYPFPFFIGEGHDTNFSLLYKNNLYSNEEGKINQVILDNVDKFPQKSMMHAFKENKIQAKDVDHWVFGGRGSVNEKKSLNYFFSKFKAKDFHFLKKIKEFIMLITM